LGTTLHPGTMLRRSDDSIDAGELRARCQPRATTRAALDDRTVLNRHGTAAGAEQIRRRDLGARREQPRVLDVGIFPDRRRGSIAWRCTTGPGS
jgi:hypothetical protein